jgi:phage portal protein BeeE
MQAAIDAFNLREHMVNYEKNMFSTGGIPKQILLTKNKVSKDDADIIKQRWKDTKPADLAVLWGGEFDLKEPNYVTARDMGYEKGLDFSQTELAQIFGVPESLIKTENVNRSNAETGEYILAKYGIQPAASRIDQKVTEQLAVQFDPLLFTMFDNPVPEDAAARREDRKTDIELGIRSRNEARREDGLEDHEGADELLVPNNIIPISQVGEQLAEQQAQFVAGRATEIAREERERRQGG